MQVTPLARVKKIGLAAMIAAVAYQPAMQANDASIFRPSPTAPMIDTLVAAVPTTEAKANTQIAQAKNTGFAGSFVGDAYAASGSAQIVEVDGQRYLELDQAFSTNAGPDLFVLLHRDAVPGSYSPDDYVNLGRLESETGAQRYAIPANVSLDDIRSAVIWCQAFDVTFSYATF